MTNFQPLTVGTEYLSLGVHIETVNRPYLGSSYHTPRCGYFTILFCDIVIVNAPLDPRSNLHLPPIKAADKTPKIHS